MVDGSPAAEAPASTNVALGAAVVTSHKVEVGLQAASLTDGLHFTLVHPRAGNLGAAFYYEIDLSQQYTLDHINLRQRNDRWDIERFSRILLQLYGTAPSATTRPTWMAQDRADGSHPEPAAVDKLQAADGQGEFTGRYLRISSDSNVPHSPQLAEVEVYATRTPQVVEFHADETLLAPNRGFLVPPRHERLLLSLTIPQPGLPEGDWLHWRLLGYREEWQPMRQLKLNFPCPPAGNYVFEVQAGHSDGTWDASTLSFPLRVDPPFTDTLLFRWLAVGLAVLLGTWAAWRYGRRRIQMLEAKSALSDERTRIARDMHDEVGARLAQLAVLQDVFASEFPQSSVAHESLAQLSRVARQAAASLDEVVWMVDPHNDTLASTAEYLAHSASDYLAPLKITCRTEAPMDWPAVEIRAQVRHQLIHAFKEALQNIVKHAGATEVKLALSCSSTHFSVRLEDNGCGISIDTSKPGQDGLRNMKSRLAEVGGHCEISPATPQGTTVALQIPLLP